MNKALCASPLMVGLLSGCAFTPQTRSGFLGDYCQLQPAPDRGGLMPYVDRSADLRP